MRLAARGRPKWTSGLVAVLLSMVSGCLSFCHPIEPPKQADALPILSQPTCCRDHVYIFIIQGLDPLDFSDLRGLRDYIQELGFKNTYFGQLYHVVYFKHEMQRIEQADPQAHFVLIGFSFGANMVRDLALAAQDAGLTIDLLFYLGGNTLDNTPHDRPPNCLMAVNILASGCIWNGTWFDNAENFHLPDVWHFGSPSHRVTLEVLTRDLALVMHNVCGEPAQIAPSAPNTLPMPRPVDGPPTVGNAEWDFMKPVARLTYHPVDDLPALPMPVTAPAAPPVASAEQHSVSLSPHSAGHDAK